MRVHLLRHGESLGNADPDRIAIPEHEGDELSERGVEQAEASAVVVAGLEIGRIVSSPMRRARRTAAAVAARTGLEPIVWDWLHEIREPSSYAGLPRVEQERQRWSNRMSQNAADPGYRPGDGESFADLLDRVERAREQLVADRVDGTLIVGHGIFFRFMFARTVLGDEFGPRHADWLWRIGSLNCGLSTFDHLDGGSDDPADIAGWRCVTWMAPTVPAALTTGTGGGGPGF